MTAVKTYAAGDATHRLTAPGQSRAEGPMGGEERAYLRLTAVDHPDRSSSFPTIPVPPVYLRVDTTHELPLIAFDAGGKEVARFRHLADLAHYLNRDLGLPATLPFPIVIAARREDGDQLELLDRSAA